MNAGYRIILKGDIYYDKILLTEVINNIGLKTTAKRLGRLIASNKELLAKEGLYITPSRSSDKRIV